VQYISEKGHSLEKLLNDGDLRKNRQPPLAYLRASGLKACADEVKVAVKKTIQLSINLIIKPNNKNSRMPTWSSLKVSLLVELRQFHLVLSNFQPALLVTLGITGYIIWSLATILCSSELHFMSTELHFMLD